MLNKRNSNKKLYLKQTKLMSNLELSLKKTVFSST